MTGHPEVAVIGDAHMNMFTGLLPVLGAELRRALHEAQAGVPESLTRNSGPRIAAGRASERAA